jgi:hypothetical protein
LLQASTQCGQQLRRNGEQSAGNRDSLVPLAGRSQSTTELHLRCRLAAATAAELAHTSVERQRLVGPANIEEIFKLNFPKLSTVL